MNQQPTYRIRDWDKHFENSESRKYKSLKWVPVMNKHDGKGYRRVAAHPKSVQVFCAWSLIIQVASKMPTRGVLLDDDGPITASDLSSMTGFPESIFEAAFNVLVDSKIGWLNVEISEDLRKSPNVPGETTVEQNRTEQNNSTAEREYARGREPDFPEIPSLETVLCHASKIGLAEWRARDWFDEMEGCGWKDHQGRQVCRWSNILNRVRTKWEADGRPSGPPAAKKTPRNADSKSTKEGLTAPSL